MPVRRFRALHLAAYIRNARIALLCAAIALAACAMVSGIR
jgi:hypothetical protein